MHSLIVNNLFELRVEQRKTCYYRIRSVSTLLLPYITDSICFALFFFHTIWIVLHIHVPSVYINVHFYLSIFYVKLNSCICQVSINVINLLRLGFRFVKIFDVFFFLFIICAVNRFFFLLFCLKSVILQTIYKSLWVLSLAHRTCARSSLSDWIIKQRFSITEIIHNFNYFILFR